MQKIDLNGKTILVTGAAGFIGSYLVKRLKNDLKGATVIGIDNMNDYYDVSLKEWRLEQIREISDRREAKFRFIQGDIASKETIDGIFEAYQPQVVVNLAAQAGVRYSISWRRAGTGPWSIWSMRRARVCMAAIRRCRSRPMTAWTIP